MEGSDNGILVFRVPQSLLAPHRLVSNKECYVRRNDRTEKMTMREMQDLTLAASQRYQSVDGRFNKLRERFIEKIDRIPDGYQRIIAVRASCVPVAGDLYIENIYNRNEAHPIYNFNRRLYENQLEMDIIMPQTYISPQPIMRGVRMFKDDSNLIVYQDAFQNGDITSEIIEVVEQNSDDYLITGWLIGNAWNAIESAYRMREAAGVPDLEFGLELEIFFRPGGLLQIDSLRRSSRTSIIGEIRHQSGIFPRYAIGSKDKLERLINQIVRDHYHNCGTTPPENLKIQ